MVELRRLSRLSRLEHHPRTFSFSTSSEPSKSGHDPHLVVKAHQSLNIHPYLLSRRYSALGWPVKLHGKSSILTTCEFLCAFPRVNGAKMASAGSTQALIKRREDEVARMPPPPSKRVKRPSEVLDEDEYTDALSSIIERDYFPGLREAQAQEEYLSALESRDDKWIREAAQKSHAGPRHETTSNIQRPGRDSEFDTSRMYHYAADTPKGFTGGETPAPSTLDAETSKDRQEEKQKADTSGLSLAAFQARFTSEDNESFNTLLDNQNSARRQKHAHLWTPDQRIPTSRQIAHRETQSKLLKQREEYKQVNGKELVPLTTGATSSRPAKPDAWNLKKPNNTLMFHPTSVDEEGLSTVQEVREAASNAGPRQIIHENTRFPPMNVQSYSNSNTVPGSPSIHTSMIARRLQRHGPSAESTVSTEYDGNATPRVNGYAYVDEDDPEPVQTAGSEPSYRDILAGQTLGDGKPNPFKLTENRKREDLHHQLVDRDGARKRAKEKHTIPDRTPGTKGNMTPAARKLMEKLGKTPMRSTSLTSKADEHNKKEMWTPVATPRRGLR